MGECQSKSSYVCSKSNTNNLKQRNEEYAIPNSYFMPTISSFHEPISENINYIYTDINEYKLCEQSIDQKKPQSIHQIMLENNEEKPIIIQTKPVFDMIDFCPNYQTYQKQVLFEL